MRNDISEDLLEDDTSSIATESDISMVGQLRARAKVIMLWTVAVVAAVANFHEDVGYLVSEAKEMIFGETASWNYYDEREVANEFVLLPEHSYSLEEAEKLKNDLRRMSDLAYILAPSSDPALNQTGTYSGALKFAKSDVLVVRSLRNAGQWEVVIDLTAREVILENSDEIQNGETQDLANLKIEAILLDLENFEGADYRIDEFEEFIELASRMRIEYFDGSSAEKYEINQYEQIYLQPLENISRIE